MTNIQLAIQFFLQLAVILLFCRLIGAIALQLGQPQVVSEMIAGVLLGPSLFGLLFPHAQAWLFPWDATQHLRDAQSYLFPASQLGLALYMFVVGMEFRVDIVRKRLRSSIAVSIAGMLTPFVLGAGLAWILFHQTELFPKRTSLAEAVLFLGASMCITAFRVLKSGGFFMATVPAYQFLWGPQDEISHHKRRYVARRLRNVLQSSGFRVTKLSYFNSILFLPIAAIRVGRRLLRLDEGAHLKSDFTLTNAGLLNSALAKIFALEASIVEKFSIPFGVSIVCVARKHGSSL